MKYVIPIITALVASVGLALILLDRFKVPSYAVSKATHNLGKRQNKKINPLEIWLKEIANWLSGKLRLNEYKRMQLDADLKTADMDMTPEMYVADNIIKSLFIAFTVKDSSHSMFHIFRETERVFLPSFHLVWCLCTSVHQNPSRGLISMNAELKMFSETWKQSLAF